MALRAFETAWPNVIAWADIAVPSSFLAGLIRLFADQRVDTLPSVHDQYPTVSGGGDSESQHNPIALTAAKWIGTGAGVSGAIMIAHNLGLVIFWVWAIPDFVLALELGRLASA